MKQCLECGTFSSDDTKFCAVCGKKFSDAVDVSPAGNRLGNDKTNSRKSSQKITSMTHPEIVPLLQRVSLFLWMTTSSTGKMKQALWSISIK